MDFVQLQPQTTEFLQKLFDYLLLYTQVTSPIVTTREGRDAAAIEAVMLPAGRIEALQHGLLYYLSKVFKRRGDELLSWGVGIAKDALRSAPGGGRGDDNED